MLFRFIDPWFNSAKSPDCEATVGTEVTGCCCRSGQLWRSTRRVRAMDVWLEHTLAVSQLRDTELFLYSHFLLWLHRNKTFPEKSADQCCDHIEQFVRCQWILCLFLWICRELDVHSHTSYSPSLSHTHTHTHTHTMTLIKQEMECDGCLSL